MILIYESALHDQPWRFLAVSSVTGSIAPMTPNFRTTTIIGNQRLNSNFLGNYICTLAEFPLLYPEECI